MVKKKFKIEGMHCVSCAMNIDGALEDLEGVECASVSFAKNEVEVEFDEHKLKDKDIAKAISAAGYKAS